MAADTDLDAIRAGLAQELEKTKQKLAMLERAYQDLTPAEERKPSKYAGLRVWLAIREYLRKVGKASTTDILNELEAGGADLGRYPLRTIKITVRSPYMKETFRVETVGNDDVVSLKNDKAEGATEPVKSGPREATRSQRR